MRARRRRPRARRGPPTTTSTSCSPPSGSTSSTSARPNSLHAEQALVALGRGVHVSARSRSPSRPRRAPAWSRPPRESGSSARPATTSRGYPLVEEMRADVAAGELGEVRSCTAATSATTCSSSGAGWRLDPDASGPSYVVGDLGTHWLDPAEHVTGLRVDRGLAPSSARTPAGALEDTRASCCGSTAAARARLRPPAGAAGRKNQLLLECEGSAGGADLGPGAPRRAAAPPRSTGRTGSSSRTRSNTVGPLRALSGRPCRGLRRGVPEHLRAPSYRAIAGEPHGGYRRSRTATGASRWSKPRSRARPAATGRRS